MAALRNSFIITQQQNTKQNGAMNDIENSGKKKLLDSTRGRSILQWGIIAA
jgi:hypothetical protein